MLLNSAWFTIDAGDDTNIHTFFPNASTAFRSRCDNFRNSVESNEISGFRFDVFFSNSAKLKFISRYLFNSWRTRTQCDHISFFCCSRSAIVSKNRRSNATPSPNEWCMRNKIWKKNQTSDSNWGLIFSQCVGYRNLCYLLAVAVARVLHYITFGHENFPRCRMFTHQRHVAEFTKYCLNVRFVVSGRLAQRHVSHKSVI